MSNVGKIDRLIRIILAVSLLVLHYTHIIPPQYGDYALIIAALLAITSLRKCCPFYALLGFGTCSADTGNTEPRIKTKKLKL